MKEWKASAKEAQKMTRDGAVSVNLVTGETTYPSDRAPEQGHSASSETAGTAGKAVDRVVLHHERKVQKKRRKKQRRAYREGAAAASRPSSRLQFSEADQAKPELQGVIRKSDKAADRLDAARDAIPNKRPGKPHANPLSRPLQEAGAAIHGKIREVEPENSGVQSGHLGERGVEKTVGFGKRRVQNWRAERKLRPWREAAKAEQAAVKANADFYYRKAVAENPQLASNPISRLWQKKRLQKQYAAAYRAAGKTAQAGKTAEATAKAARKTAQESKRTALFVKRHWKGVLIVGGIGLLLVMLLGSLQSCSSMFGGGASNFMASSYLSEDADMLAAEEAYCAKEDELREYLDTYEATHDYDEYHFDLDEIEHDPYVLISILSALHEGMFTIDQVQGDLQTLFDKQYILTETVTTETRYDSDGDPYTWTICTVTLENFDLSHVPVYMMGEDQLSLYATYMSTLGNRPDLFPSSGYVSKYIENPPTAWEIPAEYLTDERFNTLITEAEKYLGYPYVWGGSSPSTSFDCSGFVSYVLTNSGLCNTGRLGAQGLYNISTPVSAPQPGDLVFFVGTYDTTGVSHVGIYVGDGMMLHCGDPIQYSNLNTSYWQSHFYAYGRPTYN
ncbi:C40 family peptidase [Klebsiella pneumoniae]